MTTDDEWKPVSTQSVSKPAAPMAARVSRVGLAAAERARPQQPVDGTLHPAEGGVPRADVLPEAKLAARLQDPA